MLQRYQDQNGKVGMTSMFGFGYSLDSELLKSLANQGGGAYAFIPDASFVGTAFVHALANLLATHTPQASLSIEVDGGAKITELLGNDAHDITSWGATASLGPLQHGQSRDVIMRVKLPPGGTIRALLKDGETEELMGASEVVDDASHIVAPGSAEALSLDEQHVRSHFIQFITNALEHGHNGLLPAAEAERALLASDVKKTMEAYRSGALGGQPQTSEFLDGMLTDINGQVAEALSRDDWYKRWGRHYLRSLQGAHELQQANNFKDESVQGYGGNLFGSMRDHADDVFNSLPAPEPSSRPTRRERRPDGSYMTVEAQLASMGVYNRRDNPCFHAGSNVLLANGATKMIRDLRKATSCARVPRMVTRRS